jgi:DNA-binding CsgD family transcriptional regulator
MTKDRGTPLPRPGPCAGHRARCIRLPWPRVGLTRSRDRQCALADGEVVLGQARVVTEIPPPAREARRQVGLVQTCEGEGGVGVDVADCDLLGSDEYNRTPKPGSTDDRRASGRRAYDATVCRLEYAAALRRSGDRGAAASQLRICAATAQRHGFGPLLGRAHAMGAVLDCAEADAVPVPLSRLTSRERDVLVALARGSTNHQIATELFMSLKTASVHVSRILAKLGVANRIEAATLAVRHGLGGTTDLWLNTNKGGHPEPTPPHACGGVVRGGAHRHPGPPPEDLGGTAKLRGPSDVGAVSGPNIAHRDARVADHGIHCLLLYGDGFDPSDRCRKQEEGNPAKSQS